MALLPSKVLVAVDSTSGSDAAVDMARELCANVGAELHLVHVKLISKSIRSVRSRVMTPAERDAAESEGNELLDRMRRRVEAAGGEVAGAHLRFNIGLERGLAEAQEEVGAELLVVPGPPPGNIVQRLRHGGSPVAVGALLSRTSASMLVVRDPDTVDAERPEPSP